MTKGPISVENYILHFESNAASATDKENDNVLGGVLHRDGVQW